MEDVGDVDSEEPVSLDVKVPQAEVETIEPPGQPVLRFAFDGEPWRDVIRWLADESGLALQYEDLPPGSITYSDPREFTPAEAISRINLFLLSEGYTMVRSGDLLSVIDVASPRGLQKLDLLARWITIDELPDADRFEVAKCLFPLGKVDAEQAVQELETLSLLSPPEILGATNQILIVDTIEKLRSVQSILDAFDIPEMTDGTVVQAFPLQHVDAEDVLVVARPHLGLATGEMIGIDVSLSADLQGKSIFVTGVEDKVKLIERLVEAIDQPQARDPNNLSDKELRSYEVATGNVQSIYNVLQTLLANESVRLSVDRDVDTIVALATPQVHEQIVATVEQMEAAEQEFEVIPLRKVDPYFAVTLLEQMLDIPTSASVLEDMDEGEVAKLPKIDADPGNSRLFVRAKAQQIAQIKKIVEGLEATSSGSSGDVMRVLPITGMPGRKALETAARFWQQPNPIMLYPVESASSEQPLERVPADDDSEIEEAGDIPTSWMNQDAGSDAGPPRLLTQQSSSQAPLIRCQFTPRGLLVQSSDPAALDAFEDHLQMLSRSSGPSASQPVVFYLKYTKPDDALRMLREMIDGSEMLRSSAASTLVKGFVSGDSGSYLSSMVLDNEGTTTMMAGSLTIVADARLNRLIAQGTDEEIDMIEGFLRVIDKQDSLTSNQTYGTAHVIELQFTRAEEVAEAIREAFPNRIVKEEENRDPRRDPRRQDREQAERERRERELKAVETGRDLEPKLAVAVHEPSNSLIITAPDFLFSQVESLVQTIDKRGEQAISVVAPGSSAAFGDVLEEFLGDGSGASRRNLRSRDRNRRGRGR